MNNFEFRRLQKRDAEKVHRIVAREGSFRVSPSEMSVWHAQEIVDWVESDDPCYGALRGDDVVGVCLAHLHKAVRKLHIENLRVDVEWRRQRIGNRLLELTIARARQQVAGGLRVVALAKPDNIAILGLLRAAGWTRGDAVVWMQRDVGPPLDLHEKDVRQ